MKFTVNGNEYVIEFERQFRQIHSGYDHAKNEPIFKRSRYPYTTVRIIENRKGAFPGKVYREATVGAHYTEAFSLEKGRLNALRLVSKTLDKPFKKALWTAYMERDVKVQDGK